MKYIDVQTQHVRDQLYPIIGHTTAKTYFSYYGIMKDEIMFALYKNGHFYLHIPKEYLHELNQYPQITRLRDERYGINSKTFYLLPEEMMTNLFSYSHWFKQSIKSISHTRQLNYSRKKQYIRSLPNMNIQLERTLKKLGITSPSELMAQGEIAIFVNLVKIGIDVDQMMLFRLHGAIRHQYIYTLSEQEKIALLQETNSALYAAGLRKRFTIK
ncbi:MULTISPECIES: TfoX/Sxy family protein [Glaesserella]|uniref:DNA transformation protein n=1 Tax=Glaesserella australis TaxID=2094024 RepID=A0A328C5Q5_9PAST|nr:MULTISPECIES: TfoX/Sxy family protein [Glaesserella]AUI66782.1 DNA transformation protein [Glaesserella sp. 15-184]RAL19834.1 DNA transformation protein [Glaesserella australis]